MIDYELKSWQDMWKNLFLYSRLGSSPFDFDWKWVKNWRVTFDNLIAKNADAWDYFWIFSGLKHRLLSIVPNRNLIQNIGFHESATHTRDLSHPVSKIQTLPMEFPLEHPQKVMRNTFFEEEYVKKIWQSYFRKNFGYQLRAWYRDVIHPEED